MKHAVKTPAPPCWHNDDALLARRLVVLALTFAILGCLALSIDTLAGWVFLGEAGPIWHVLRKGLKRLVDPTETFANGLGIILILLALFAADVVHRRGLLRAVVVIFGAGILANVVKCSIGRTRPKIAFDVDTDQFTSGAIASFQGWLPLWKLGYAGQSFPSGHTTVAVALAIVLCRRWPGGSWAFIALAVMAGLQRIAFGHHYPSDCLCGAALACTIAAVCYHPRMLGRSFGRFERATSGASCGETLALDTAEHRSSSSAA